MGGRPLTSLALVCFPEKGDLEILERILAGGLSKMMEAGCTVVGGHSIRDDETKFGYSVTGLIHPQRVLANGGAVAGDRLLFTKALGTGVISTAIKRGVAQGAWVEAAVRSMTTLNKTAAEVICVGPDAPVWAAGQSPAEGSQVELRSNGQTGASVPTRAGATWVVHSLTDVTGFGLIGHAREMALASNVGLRLFAGRIPLLEGAVECVRAGYIPGGLKANREFAECVVGYEAGISDEVKTLLFDPQTAGGLLIAVAAEGSEALQQALTAAGVAAVEVGEVVPASKPLIFVAA
jgi:selenide,water dikinase